MWTDQPTAKDAHEMEQKLDWSRSLLLKKELVNENIYKQTMLIAAGTNWTSTLHLRLTWTLWCQCSIQSAINMETLNVWSPFGMGPMNQAPSALWSGGSWTLLSFQKVLESLARVLNRTI